MATAWTRPPACIQLKVNLTRMLSSGPHIVKGLNGERYTHAATSLS